MTRRRARTRPRRRLGPAAVALALAAPLPAVAITPSPSSSSPGSVLPVSVQLADLTPLAPQHHDVLRLTGTLRNVSPAPVTDLAVQLRYDPTHIGSRSQFDAYAGAVPGAPNAGPLPLPPATVDGAAAPLQSRTLAPGRSEPFLLQVPVDSLSLDRAWQVFELGVQVNGSTTTGFGPVGGLRTLLPWAPVDQPGHGEQTQVAWIWPLVDQPHRIVGGTFTDDTLARSLAPTGRLGQLLAAGAAAQNQLPPPAAPAVKKKSRKPAKPTPTPVAVSAVPVTWAVDPMLVEDAGLMTGRYRVAGRHGSGAGSGSAAADAWLAALRSATARADVLALPYADPDVVAADRWGLSAAVQVATNSGSTLLSRALSTTPLSYAWPPSGMLDQNTLDTLFAAGVSTVILDDRALPPVTDPNVTPNARTTIRARDGNLDALLVDHTLYDDIASGIRDPSQQRLGLQRFLAETLMIQSELPSDQRTVVVAPDRRWAPEPSYASALVSDTGKVPWIRPVSLTEALATPETPGVTRAALDYTARRAELSRGYLEQVQSLQGNADSFASILAPGDADARAFDDAVLRTLSSAWRTHRDAADHYRSSVSTALDATKRKVRIASAAGSFVTLTSHSGTVPITVTNELDTPVRVTVKISSQHLQVSGGGRAAETIPAHRQIAVDVRATARTSGVFPLDVKLLTPTGETYDSTQLFVRSTAYGSVALLITGGATGMLLLAVIVRLVRRARAARLAVVDTA